MSALRQTLSTKTTEQASRTPLDTGRWKRSKWALQLTSAAGGSTRQARCAGLGLHLGDCSLRARAAWPPACSSRLTTQWQAEQRVFAERRLDDRDYVYVWADGVHFNVRLEEERLCCLVIVGVRVDGTKELVAIGDGYRESTESWADLMRDLKRRGMRAPVLAVGDGALGFWGA